MAVPATPQNFTIQQGGGQIYLSWSTASSAASYILARSTDNITYANISTANQVAYLDTAVTVGTQYYYQVAAVNLSGSSSFAAVQSTTPCLTGQMSLGEIRLRAQQRADMQNSNFVSKTEWNYYINQSYYELYDLLITTYEDYYVAPRVTFATTGSQSYALPNGSLYNGAPAFYKMFGVDLGIDSSNNAYVTLKKFDFIQRNRYVFPQITANFLGVFSLQYRVVGGNVMFIPTPSGGQTVGLWYFPRLSTLLQDSDIMDGISGWTEYVIVDAAIKALNKEESDVTALMNEKLMLKKRIEESAANRDAGQPDTISATRTWAERWGGGWGGGADGPSGGV